MGRLRQFRRNAFLKNLSDSRANGSFQLVPFIFLAYIPGIHVLAGHNAVDANVPHHRRAVPTGFELVIDLLLLVGTLNGRAAFVNQPPPPTRERFWETGEDYRCCVYGMSARIWHRSTPAGQRASPLAAILVFSYPRDASSM